MIRAQSLFRRLGGREPIAKVHEICLSKMLAEPKLAPFFLDVEAKHLVSRQTDFIAQAFGGPTQYRGEPAAPTHRHLFITRDLFALRHDLLAESLDEAGVSAPLAREWLDFDAAFDVAIVKKCPAECAPRTRDGRIICAPTPADNGD